MKSRFAITTLFFMISYLAFCQKMQPSFEGHTLRGFEGKWIGVQNNDTFIVVLKHKDQINSGNANSPTLFDVIVGWHCYIKNGVIESSSIGDSLVMSNSSIVIGKDMSGKQFVSFNDNNRKNGSVKVSLTMNSRDPNKIIWRIIGINPEEHNRFIINGDTIPKYPKESYIESQLTQIKEWSMKRIEN